MIGVSRLRVSTTVLWTTVLSNNAIHNRIVGTAGLGPPYGFGR